MNEFVSRASRMPARHYKRHFTISRHAVERFRDRVGEEFQHRDDDDLGNLLDERAWHAESTYQVRDPRAPDDITTLRSVACRHATYYVVVRDATIVTVLDEQMARNNFDGQWEVVMNAPFEALRGFKISATDVSGPDAPETSETQIDAPADVATDVRAGVVLSSPVVAADPLAEAGVAYARAQGRLYEYADLVRTLEGQLDRAKEKLRAAALVVDEAHRRLIDVAMEPYEISCGGLSILPGDPPGKISTPPS